MTPREREARARRVAALRAREAEAASRALATSLAGERSCEEAADRVFGLLRDSGPATGAGAAAPLLSGAALRALLVPAHEGYRARAEAARRETHARLLEARRARLRAERAAEAAAVR
ncbi:MAG: hypothetical protein SNJ79_09600, partial [Sphingomonadaceae bacterium]